MWASVCVRCVCVTTSVCACVVFFFLKRTIPQVRGMLEDDGIFFLQIAGLRRAWQFEDLTW